MAKKPFPLAHLPWWQNARQVREEASSAETKPQETEWTDAAGLNKQLLLGN